MAQEKYVAYVGTYTHEIRRIIDWNNFAFRHITFRYINIINMKVWKLSKF